MTTMLDRFVLKLSPKFGKETLVYVIGCGATGGYIAVMLAKMGFTHFVLFDPDKVETPNIGVQIYDMTYDGLYKTVALTELIQLHSDGTAHCRAHNVRFVAPDYNFNSNYKHHLVIPAVDNVESRRVIYKAWNASSAYMHALFIDPRMALEHFEVWATAKNGPHVWREEHRIEYETVLGVDVEPAPCGLEATPYTAMMCAATTVRTIVQWANDQPFRHWEFHDIENAHITKGDLLGATAEK
jgi:hypothetical protein